jgi:magnesium transporter
VRKISAWFGIISVPTFIASLYGMNFQHMPELGWRAGYWITLGAMAVLAFLLYLLFKRIRWL